MADIHWKRAVGGNFDKPGAWEGGAVPGPGDDAILDAAGSDFTVVSNTTQSIDGVELADNATLKITRSTFTANAGTGSGANAGTIGIYGKAVLSVGGNLDNTGVISLNGAGNRRGDAPTLMIGSDTTLTGGGEIDLNDNRYNNVSCNGTTLTNVDNLITGAGVIGSRNVDLALVNEAGGVIDATGTNVLHILRLSGPRGSLTNDGLLEGSGSGGLLITRLNIAGSGGSIVANSGSSVSLGACSVSGQSLSTQAGGNIELTLAHVQVATPTVNAGHLDVESSNVALDDGMTNAGLVIVDSGVVSVRGAVTGNGEALLYGGKLEFFSAFSQNVVFAVGSGAGTLLLGDSQAYTGDISGFSATGASILDLRDIGFVDAGEATFSGTMSSGTLTVTDGTHTASIALFGDYLGVDFVAASDGHGGTTVVAKGGAPASPHAFVAAMAGLGAPKGGAIEVSWAPSIHEPALAAPHVNAA